MVNLQRGECVGDYNDVTGVYCGEWKGATLKRLPVFGRKYVSVNDTTFEWPTKDIFAKMTPDVKLQSIEFKGFE